MSSVVNRSKHGLYISSLKSDQLAHFHFSSLHKQALAPGFFKHYWPALVRTKVSSGKDMPQAPKLLINHLQYHESTKRLCLTVYGARRSSAILRDSSTSSTQEQPALLVNNRLWELSEPWLGLDWLAVRSSLCPLELVNGNERPWCQKVDVPTLV